jgi:hypothetical protein
VSVISTPFPWSPLKLHSNSTPWSGNGVGVAVCGVGVTVCGIGVKICGVGVEICGVGVGMELEILNFSETSIESIYKALKSGIDS